jgi:hypothetical protein
MDQMRLDQVRKLLDLTPRGRLTDTEDAEFGNRKLRSDEEMIVLDLWRLTDESWRVGLWYEYGAPRDHVVDQLRGEVLALARQLGFTVGRVSGTRAQPLVAGPPVELPTRPALSARLEGPFDVSTRATMQRILNMRREGLTGRECGWRYLRRDSAGKVLLQMYHEYPDKTEVVLLYDREPPDEATLEGVRLQLCAAAAKAGLGVERAEPMPDAATWERLGAPAAGAADLDEAFSLLGVTAETPLELRRGLLLATTMSSAWREPATRLRNEVFEYLIGIEVRAHASPGPQDHWL